MKLIILVLHLTAALVLVSEQAEAQRGRSSGRGSSGGPGLLSAGVMISLGQGKMGNGTDVEDRSMIHTPIAAFVGFNFKKFRLGAQYEYSLIGQSTDPASVNNTNLAGKSTATGARLDYWDGKQAFGLIYRLSDSFKLDNQSGAGTEVEYKSKGGFQVQYYRQIKKQFGFVVDYTSETFDESLPNNIKWDRISVGIVLTNFTSTGRR